MAGAGFAGTDVTGGADAVDGTAEETAVGAAATARAPAATTGGTGSTEDGATTARGPRGMTGATDATGATGGLTACGLNARLPDRRRYSTGGPARPARRTIRTVRDTPCWRRPPVVGSSWQARTAGVRWNGWAA
ncbi:hypothetical protein GCM10018781_11150 [Kitasatospora indigofera]|uniref:Uncharacterized protein n=1 Tax=Kitasatospora indigofera TaxID=67307 RepID=A0A919FDW1_9ACTN|nr:hypothetical protein GCM10018781_11150 [Kitasatospora indigofera]